jgi:5-formyltetrahydrofolate cyclo-ligase
MDCMLVPLVAFDSHHHRIGMGGGFYDRYLSSYQHKKPFLLGLSFQEQWCHTVPHDPWDQPLDAIATAGGIF